MLANGGWIRTNGRRIPLYVLLTTFGDFPENPETGLERRTMTADKPKDLHQVTKYIQWIIKKNTAKHLAFDEDILP